MAGHYLMNSCIRERVNEGIDTASALYIQVDFMRNTCLLLNTVNEESESITSFNWVIYKIVFY